MVHLINVNNGAELSLGHHHLCLRFWQILVARKEAGRRLEAAEQAQGQWRHKVNVWHKLNGSCGEIFTGGIRFGC